MAKKRSAKRGRGSSPTATSFVPLSDDFPVLSPPTLQHDRRRYEPDRSSKAPASTLRNDTKIKLAAKVFTKAAEINTFRRSLYIRLNPWKRLRYGRRVSHRVAFNVPKRVEMCIRRAVRSRVLHAKRKTGAGKPKQRRPNRNFWSAISCRR